MIPRHGRVHRRIRLGLLTALVCLLGLAGSAAASDLGVEPDYAISERSTDPPTPYQAFDAVTIAAVDLTGDGTKEIVAHNDNQKAYIFDGDRTRVIAELSTNHPDGWTARPLTGPAIGDVTGNGVTDIVLTNSAAWTTAFEARPTYDDRQLEITRLWETRLDPEQQDSSRDWERPATDAPPFLADTDADGRDETFNQLDDQVSRFKLGPDGGVQEWNDHGDGNGGPVVADVTHDGGLEAVFPSDGGRVTIYEAGSMQWRCQFDAEQHGVWPGSISVSPTLADVTGDTDLEILFGVRNVPKDAPYEGWEDDSHAHYFALDSNCNVVWQKTWEWSNPHVHMRPVPMDLTGDGDREVLFQDWNTVGHKPGNWQHTGPSNLFAVDGDTGELLWRSELNNYWSNKNIAVGDVTGDGTQDILANEVDGRDGIGIYDEEGIRRGFVSTPSGWVVSKGPTLADLDNDGDLEMILPIHRDSDHCQSNPDLGCREGALQIYDAPDGSDPLYPNNHMRNADEGKARSTDSGGSDGDTSSGSFDASFENVRGNEWWQEVDVQSAHTVASVHLRIDGGDWVGMEKKDWGSWAEDEHAPEGAIVQFQARNNDGDRALSDCYAWGEDQSKTSCPDSSGGSTDGDTSDGFDASFENVRGNEWWIETDVTSDRSITGVDVSLDGGSWIALDKQDYGSWARSEHAPEGTLVQFRAHSGSEARTTSGCYSWGEDPSATSCTGGSSDGGSGSFDASFVEPRGNEWWVEVDVNSDDAIASASARVDGGSWFSLHKTDWGSWARDTHVGEDVTVEFRATNGAGETDMSDPIAWPP